MLSNDGSVIFILIHGNNVIFVVLTDQHQGLAVDQDQGHQTGVEGEDTHHPVAGVGGTAPPPIVGRPVADLGVAAVRSPVALLTSSPSLLARKVVDRGEGARAESSGEGAGVRRAEEVLMRRVLMGNCPSRHRRRKISRNKRHREEKEEGMLYNKHLQSIFILS